MSNPLYKVKEPSFSTSVSKQLDPLSDPTLVQWVLGTSWYTIIIW